MAVRRFEAGGGDNSITVGDGLVSIETGDGLDRIHTRQR